MPSKFLASVRHFLRPLLRVLGMTTLSSRPQEFPQQSSIEDWEAILRSFYVSHDSDSSPLNSKDMKYFKITKIRRYKERRNLEHEYLVAEVSTKEPGELRYLRIERSAEDPVPTKSEKSSFYTLPTLSSQSSLIMSNNLPAKDHVYSVTGWPADNCIRYLDCRNAQIILLDLVIAAKVVHDHSSMYQLFKRQCFWYSDVVVAILEQEFPLIQLVESFEDHSQKTVEVLDEASGTFKSFPFYSRRTPIVNEIHDLYRIQRADVYLSIAKAAAAAEQSALKLKNADKRVEDAVRRAEEAQKDADRRAEEAQKDADRRAEEAQKDADRRAEEAQKDADRRVEEAQKEKALMEEALTRRIQELEATTQVAGRSSLN